MLSGALRRRAARLPATTTASRAAAATAAALRASEARFRQLIESTDQGWCVIQMIFDEGGHPVDYRFVETNPAFEQQTGLVDALGRTMRELAPVHETHWFELYGEVAVSGKPQRFINEARALGRWFDVYAMRVGRPDERRVGLLFTDITDRKLWEDDLRRLTAELSRVDRLKSEFLATLAHELRNPLAPLRNGLEILRRTNDPALHERAREMMSRQLVHLVRLVDDLLDVARITSGKVDLQRRQIDLADVLRTAVELAQPLMVAREQRFELRVPAQPLRLDGDATRLAQVFGNLLTNAAKYTPSGGRIELIAERVGDEAVVRVRDTGIGIAPHALGRVFDLFTQLGRDPAREVDGLGIGLSLVRRLVDLHGGAVDADSAGEGQGSTFTVRLPVEVASDAVAVPPPRRADAPAGRRLEVLVVDDNVDAAESLALLVGLAGHHVRVAHDGSAALHLAQERTPGVVFLDIGLPGLSGHEVARVLRAMPGTRDALLVALTGWGTDEDRTRSRQAGFDEHLVKPADAAIVASLLAARAAAGEPVPAG